MLKKRNRDKDKDTCIQSFFAHREKLDIYEASAGKGDLVYKLMQQGHNVVASNLEAGPLKSAGIMARSVNLEKPLPFPENSFDVVILREVIEHIDNLAGLLLELHRLLKPNGMVVVTFPNKISIKSRVYHLLTGFFYGLPAPTNLEHPYGYGHVNVKSYPEMDYAFRKCGFDVTSARTSYKPVSMYFYSILHPVIFVATYFFLFLYKKNAEDHRKDRPEDIAYNRSIFNRITSSALLYGKDVVLCAEKQNC